MILRDLSSEFRRTFSAFFAFQPGCKLTFRPRPLVFLHALVFTDIIGACLFGWLSNVLHKQHLSQMALMFNAGTGGVPFSLVQNGALLSPVSPQSYNSYLKLRLNLHIASCRGKILFTLLQCEAESRLSLNVLYLTWQNICQGAGSNEFHI